MCAADFRAGRPRWGAYSTKGHLDKRSLLVDLLLFDKLLFPTPQADAVEHWKDEDWQPEAQEKLLKELGDELAYRVSWAGVLKARFDEQKALREQALQAEHLQHPDVNLEAIAAEIAYPQTAMLIAAAAAKDPMFVANEPIPPIPVAVFQSELEAKAAYALQTLQPSVDGVRSNRLGAELGALFTRTLNVPQAGEGLEDTFQSVIALAKTANYQKARRALYDWEARVTQDEWPVDRAKQILKDLALEHDDLVREHFKDSVKIVTIQVASVVIPPLVGGVTGLAGLLGGIAAGGLLQLVSARAPKIKDPYQQPGAALSMAMNAVWKLKQAK